VELFHGIYVISRTRFTGGILPGYATGCRAIFCPVARVPISLKIIKR